jgi:hypothetical protein
MTQEIGSNLVGEGRQSILCVCCGHSKVVSSFYSFQFYNSPPSGKQTKRCEPGLRGEPDTHWNLILPQI